MAQPVTKQPSPECDSMEPPRPITARVSAGILRFQRRANRRLPLDLYELEPESGDDERLQVDLDLDQIEA